MKRTIFALLCGGIMIAGFSTVSVAQDKTVKTDAKVQDNKADNGGTKTVKFSVSMTCENCVTKITENVSYEKGVKDLKVSLENKTVEVTYDPSKTNEKTLSEEITKLGYTVEVVGGSKNMEMKNAKLKSVDDINEKPAEKAGDKIKETGETVGEKTKETAVTVGEKTKETAVTVGEKTKETANKVGDKTKDAANKVGDFFKKDKTE